MTHADRERGEDLQNPLTHEGAEPDRRDPNEAADDKATVVEPEGDEGDR